ncbi:MAG: NAD(P)-dependent oxidoreductase [Ignavibacteriae bacterium]|nr:NAD(P)-dependent oxidoreductase [Ignavibacteria bacterium]MBI3363777.1 NAD(P)-dependent oxidoreductase [Ignavibacteriota bacterium]
MNNTAPKLTNEQYEKNFADIHPAFTQNQAVTEANRCLYCFDSPCMKACPTHIDISTFIKKIATGNVKGSAKTILASNWIALTCAKACPVDVLCEGACVYNDRGEEPIKIGRLQRYAIDWYFEHGMPALFTPAPKNGKSVGVIGAGPSGLACAAELALLGYDVTIYEGKDVAGGLDTWGIAPYKMTYKDSLNEVKLVQSFGVTIKTGMWIGKNLTIAELEKKHDAIFIGVGLGKSPSLKIPGEDLKGVVDALDFIASVTPRKWSTVDVGHRVAVIGAGNTAIDAATEAKRLGAEQVTIVYRRGENDMSAYDFEYELAKNDGILFHFHTAPQRIIGNGTVEALECVKMRLRNPVAKGKQSLEPVPKSEFQIPVDMIIKAIGQDANENFLEQIGGMEFVDGNVAVNTETMRTANPKYFAGGDCINGGKEVVNAAADGKKAAHGIDTFIFNKR